MVELDGLAVELGGAGVELDGLTVELGVGDGDVEVVGDVVGAAAPVKPGRDCGEFELGFPGC